MTTTPTTTARIVAAGLDRVTAAICAVPTSATHDVREHSCRADRLHVLYARRARWWAVLERAAATDPTIPLVYVRAVVHARCTADQQATEWAMTADRWLDHARGLDAAGTAVVRGVSA